VSRFSAFGIHLGLSFVIFLVLAYLVVFEWYPGMFFDTDGGWRGMRIIVAVDLVLGPTLTLVVFKQGKPGLRTDLTLIGILQFACLAAGTYVVYTERPLAVVYNDGRFAVMSADDYHEANIDVPDLRHIPGDMPKWVMVEVPTNLSDEADFRGKYIEQRRSVTTAVEAYTQFSHHHPQFTGQAQDIDFILSRDGGEAALTRFLEQHGGSIDDYAFYPISTRYYYLYLAFRKGSGERLGVLDISAAY